MPQTDISGAGRTALLLSPHLDDVAFSCGGTAAMLSAAGWRVIIASVFTRSVHPATGFALACQRDKNLPDHVDYMALRRQEDLEACSCLGATQVLLDLPEAPNRGYGSAASLFETPHADDAIRVTLVRCLSELLDAEAPSLVLAPQGCGGHVDHLQLIAALISVGPAASVPLGFYRDTPYVIRDPAASVDPSLAAIATHRAVIRLDAVASARKQAAVACYRTQLGFQFGGAAGAAEAIEALMTREAVGQPFDQAESLLLSDPAVLAGFAR